MFIERVTKDNIEAFISKFMNTTKSNPLERKYDTGKTYRFKILYSSNDEIVVKVNGFLYRFSDYAVHRYKPKNKIYIYSDVDSEHWLYFMNRIFRNEYEQYFMYNFADNPSMISKFKHSTASLSNKNSKGIEG